MAIAYPKRGSHFAHRAVRLMIKSCAANRIGQTGTWLVATIAMTEDAKRYRGPVTFYNEQLMPIIGVTKWESLDRARKAAVDAGWLHYECPGNRKPGIYWTLIPSSLDRAEDSPVDETLYPLNGDDAQSQSYPFNGDNEGDNRGYDRGYNEGEPPVLLRNTPNPTPSPIPKSAPADAAGCPPDLKAWIDWWNRLRAESLVSCATGCDPPSDAVLRAWTRVRKNAALRELLTDRDAIDTAIRESPFCREGWFRLEKLFGGKNRDGEFIIRKLLDRGYVRGSTTSSITIGPGQKHDPTVTEAGPTVW